MTWAPTPYDTRTTVTPAEADEYRAAVRPGYEERFKELTHGQPLDLIYGLGPHSLPIIEEVLAHTKAKTVLEIGFGAGASACMFLGLDPELKMLSVDSSTDERLLEAALLVGTKFPGRFDFINQDSALLSRHVGRGAFDLIFIDGDHRYAAVRSDLALAKAKRIKWVLLDDWWPHFGEGVQTAAAEAGEWLRPVRQWGNVMLMRGYHRTAPAAPPPGGKVTTMRGRYAAVPKGR